MPFCAVKLCGKNSRTSNYKEHAISFHRFPQIAIIRDAWMKATKQDADWIPTKYSVICSRHFTEDSFVIMKKRRSLHENAVPTLNIPIVTNASESLGSLSFASGSVIRANMVQEILSDPTSMMIQTTPVVKLEHGLDVDANTTPFIKIEPGLSNEHVQTIPLEQTNQVVIKIEEGKDAVKAEPGLLVLPPAKNPPNEPQFNVIATPSDPLGIEVDDEPLEYLQSTKKKLWNTIISLREKLKMKNSKIKRLHEHNRRMRLKIEDLETRLKAKEDSTIETEDDMDCDFVEKDDE